MNNRSNGNVACLVTKQNCWFICVAIVGCLIMFTHNPQEYSIWEYTWKIANIKEIRNERMKNIINIQWWFLP